MTAQGVVPWLSLGVSCCALLVAGLVYALNKRVATYNSTNADIAVILDLHKRHEAYIQALYESGGASTDSQRLAFFNYVCFVENLLVICRLGHLSAQVREVMFAMAEDALASLQLKVDLIQVIESFGAANRFGEIRHAVNGHVPWLGTGAAGRGLMMDLAA